MAKNVFDPEKTYQCRLDGIMFTNYPEGVCVRLPGHLDADTVESDDHVFGKQEFAVFTVNDHPNGAYSPKWVGTYRLPMERADSWLSPEQMPESVFKKFFHANEETISEDSVDATSADDNSEK